MNDFTLTEQNLELETETIGTLNLQIARLERYLHLLNQQQLLSQPYPDHKAALARKSYQAQFQLCCLKQRRQKLLDHNDSNCVNRISLMRDGQFKAGF